MATNFIKFLVENKYSIFNVSDKKAPVNRQGFGMGNWIEKSFDELCFHHNYNSKLWGMKMGEHENGRFVLSLDFDVCGKEVNGVRIGCPETQKYLDEYLNNFDREDGLFDSSTDGNVNVLIDYTHSPQIQKLVKELNSNKFNLFDFEILLGGNQVIPPSATICKKTKKLEKIDVFEMITIFMKLNHRRMVLFLILLKIYLKPS